MTAITLSSYAGLVAVALVTVNICLGLLIAVRYSPVRRWPHRRFNIFALHNWTAYLALITTLLHPALLLFPSRVPFRLVDVLLPLWSPQQPVENTLGAVALYILLVVLVTSYWRQALGRRPWKRLHFLVYPMAALLFAHGLLTDPELNHQAVDWFDGEKVFVEVCLLLVTVFSLWAWRHRVRRDRQERALHVGRYHFAPDAGD